MDREKIAEIIAEFGLTPANHSLEGFAEACYNDNSIEELVEALREGVDATDRSIWELTEGEAIAAVRAALESKLMQE